MANQQSIAFSPVVLSFNCHDATGASGVSADIESIASQGCHASTVITCLSVQDTQIFSDLIPVDEDIITQSARAVLEDIPVAAFKIGLIGSEESAGIIREILLDYPQTPVILDPVLVSTDGIKRGEKGVIEAICDLLIPLTTGLILNAGETTIQIPGADNQNAMIQSSMDSGCEYILLRGQLDGTQRVVNKLYHQHRMIEEYEWLGLREIYHGAEDTLSASLAALLAQGLDFLSATREAQNYCRQALKHATRYGMGQHQLSRLYWMHESE